jgi:hypothetical protein
MNDRIFLVSKTKVVMYQILMKTMWKQLALNQGKATHLKLKTVGQVATVNFPSLIKQKDMSEKTLLENSTKRLVLITH